MFSAILILLAMPFSDLAKLRGIQFKPLKKTFFFIFIGNLLLLMVLGAKHVESPYIEFGQITTLVYFVYFLLQIPMNSLFENSISEFYIRINQTFSRLYNYTDINGNKLGKRNSPPKAHIFVSLPLQSSFFFKSGGIGLAYLSINPAKINIIYIAIYPIIILINIICNLNLEEFLMNFSESIGENLSSHILMATGVSDTGTQAGSPPAPAGSQPAGAGGTGANSGSQPAPAPAPAGGGNQPVPGDVSAPAPAPAGFEPIPGVVSSGLDLLEDTYGRLEDSVKESRELLQEVDTFLTESQRDLFELSEKRDNLENSLPTYEEQLTTTRVLFGGTDTYPVEFLAPTDHITDLQWHDTNNKLVRSVDKINREHGEVEYLFEKATEESSDELD